MSVYLIVRDCRQFTRQFSVSYYHVGYESDSAAADDYDAADGSAAVAIYGALDGFGHEDASILSPLASVPYSHCQPSFCPRLGFTFAAVEGIG